MIQEEIHEAKNYVQLKELFTSGIFTFEDLCSGISFDSF